nr:hypothetical protein [Arthrospira sp. SH-MAG29]
MSRLFPAMKVSQQFLNPIDINQAIAPRRRPNKIESARRANI